MRLTHFDELKKKKISITFFFTLAMTRWYIVK